MVRHPSRHQRHQQRPHVRKGEEACGAAMLNPSQVPWRLDLVALEALVAVKAVKVSLVARLWISLKSHSQSASTRVK